MNEGRLWDYTRLFLMAPVIISNSGVAHTHVKARARARVCECVCVRAGARVHLCTCAHPSC